MSGIDLDAAIDLCRTGDLWLFRGSSGADRAIRGVTNAPVNHVGMAIVVDDLPPLMWHAELGQRLPDLWAGKHQRGVQLHDLRAAVLQWGHRYAQRPWLRQLEGPGGRDAGGVTREMEDAALRTVARLDGTPFPSTARLAGRWLRGRAPRLRSGRGTDSDLGAELATAYCAEVVAVTYEEMGLLPTAKRANWYDPGRFWSGDELELTPPYRLGGEISVTLPAAPSVEGASTSRLRSAASWVTPWRKRATTARSSAE
ncbi:hypothetical protein GCM10009836_11210 [Pseudonocardia ailaonensis]|uniref:Guanylate cyclase n=1 Tax=Pseudonocardia ailaonensis TaxID=367279 RepID=A0ABN2MQX2_9PSEU